MTGKDPDEDARRLAGESLAGGDPTGWFERLYAGSAAGEAVVPWDSGGPHPLLVAWTAGRKPEEGDSPKALVVGAGLGDDAEHLAALGHDTTAFDVSESAVRLARERFPGTAVSYQVADLLDPPAAWRRAFDLVVEIMTVQALPEPLHQDAIERVASFVRPGGTLLVIASGRDEGDPVGAPPWPLTRAEITAFAVGGLGVGEIEDLREPGRRRWRATFHRLMS
ncbi:class I SAM-dependent methyltransferase [Nonomuraea sp. SMC257]|uniref:Class I SAM-dependent methyltransferase n=2 Tax=Nonomuraea montanisoli TaxID=2741721 RepID=A0A7Y6IEK3_9ACTN|nr:class I SAM-dependent methyltransferase [Nonomuraea montanisoli]